MVRDSRDRKWSARIAAASVLVDTLMRIDPKFPVLDSDRIADLEIAKYKLEAEAPDLES